MKAIATIVFRMGEIVYRTITIYDFEYAPLHGARLYCFIVDNCKKRAANFWVRYGTAEQLLSFWRMYRGRYTIQKKERDKILKMLEGLEK